MADVQAGVAYLKANGATSVAIVGAKLGANLAGLPGISVPCGFVDGLPVGLHLVGPHFGESALLRCAHQYQLATDWHARAPEGFA